MKRLILVVSGALLLASCGENVREPESPAGATPAIAVNTVTASIDPWPSTYETTGTVRARSSAVISAKWMGYVREVKVRVGDRVTAGQLLAILDAADLDAASNRASAARSEVNNAIPEADSVVAAAKAHLDLVEATHRRMRELYEKTSISDQEFDESTAKLKAAQADLVRARARRTQLDDKLAAADQDIQSAKVNRGYAEIRSPAAGVVSAKSVEPGNLAVPGSPLLTIESGGFRLEIPVEESRMSSIRLGASATVRIDGLDGMNRARVSETVPAVDAASRSYVAKLDLPALAGLRSGMFGRATFAVGSRPVLSIPRAAVIERGQLESVFVADTGVARTRLITTGSQSQDRIEVLSGLEGGEKLIAPVPKNLTDGARIEVRP